MPATSRKTRTDSANAFGETGLAAGSGGNPGSGGALDWAKVHADLDT